MLRAAINYGNPVLAQAGPAANPGRFGGAGRRAGQELGVALELVTYDAAGKVFADLDSGAWNLAFMAIEPVRAAQIAFSEPYVIIEGTYLVANDAPYFEVAQLDRPEVRIAVGQGRRTICFIAHAAAGAAGAGGNLRRGDRAVFERGWRRRPACASRCWPPRPPIPATGCWRAFHRHPPGDGGARQNAGRRLRERFYRALQSQRVGEGGLAAQRPGRVTVAPPAASA